jgi:hypothetical protein
MDDLMSQDDAIHDLSAFYVPCLFLGDDMCQNGFDLIVYYLRYDFVDNIAEGDGSKLFRVCDSFFFWNEGEKGGIKSQ